MDYFAIILAVVFIAYVSLWRPRKDALLSAFLALLVVILAASMILFPEPSFKAAERGLTVWWNIVLPALLPFFIAAEPAHGDGSSPLGRGIDGTPDEALVQCAGCRSSSWLWG